ncbi:MAG: hypothetical protein RJA44_700 [Pseudomonadota bacterium]
MSLSTFVFQAVLALLLGALVGLERQWHRRLGDLKTNALVALGAALFMSVSASAEGWTEPIRMAGQIVVGVGFIGGGLLLHNGTQVRGINTATTLWCCAAVGTLCGLGRLAEAAWASALLVLANIVLRAVATRLRLSLGGDSLIEQVSFTIECDPGHAPEVRQDLEDTLRAQHADLRLVSEEHTPRASVLVTVVAAFENRDIHAEIDAVLAAAERWSMYSLSWRRL